MKKIIGSLAFFLLFYAAQSALAAGESYSLSIGDSPQKGPKEAAVTIIEFLDFQ